MDAGSRMNGSRGSIVNRAFRIFYETTFFTAAGFEEDLEIMEPFQSHLR